MLCDSTETLKATAPAMLVPSGCNLGGSQCCSDAVAAAEVTAPPPTAPAAVASDGVAEKPCKIPAHGSSSPNPACHRSLRRNRTHPWRMRRGLPRGSDISSYPLDIWSIARPARKNTMQGKTSFAPVGYRRDYRVLPAQGLKAE